MPPNDVYELTPNDINRVRLIIRTFIQAFKSQDESRTCFDEFVKACT